MPNLTFRVDPKVYMHFPIFFMQSQNRKSYPKPHYYAIKSTNYQKKNSPPIGSEISTHLGDKERRVRTWFIQK